MLCRGVCSERLGRKQHADPLFLATLEYLRRGRPILFPADPLTALVDLPGVRVALRGKDVLELADKFLLFESLDAKMDVLTLLFCKPFVPGSDQPTTGHAGTLLGDEATMIFVSYSARPFCHATFLFGRVLPSRCVCRTYCACLSDSTGDLRYGAVRLLVDSTLFQVLGR